MRKSLYSKNQEKLCKWLKTQRLAKDLSMRELAVDMDAPHSFIGKTETGERRLDVVEFIAYCKALGVSPIDGLKAVDPKL